ncbi:MAG: hypothetical protein WA632_08125 [Gallionella sp.]
MLVAVVIAVERFYDIPLRRWLGNAASGKKRKTTQLPQHDLDDSTDDLVCMPGRQEIAWRSSW